MAINNAINASQTGVQCQTSGGVWNGRTITAGTGITVSNGDGVSGNPTISATPSPGGLSVVYLYEDFLGQINAGGIGNTNLPINGSGSSYNFVSGTGTNPGIVNISVSNNGNIGAVQTHSFVLGAGAVIAQWIDAIPTLSDVTNTFFVRIGVFDNNASTSGPNNGCWFEYTNGVNSGKWTINCKDGGGTNTQNTNSTVDTSYHTYTVSVNAAGTSVSFLIDGVEVTGSPIATHIPTAVLGCCSNINKTAGAVARTLNLDLMILQITLTTPRPG